MTEIVDVYDQYGQPQGYVKPRQQLNADEYLLTVHIYIYDRQQRFLWQQRAFTKTLMPGVWCLTGGVVISHEESWQAAIRETQEELGLTLTNPHLHYLGRCLNNHFVVDSFLAYLPDENPRITLKTDEVINYRWNTLAETLSGIRALSENQPAYTELISKGINEYFSKN